MNAIEINKMIVHLLAKLIDKPLSSGEIEYSPETYRFVLEELRKNFLRINNKTLESMLRANAKMLMVICYEIIQTTALEKRINDMVKNYTTEKQRDLPKLQMNEAYEVKAFELSKTMANTINKLLGLPVGEKLENLYRPEIHEPKIEVLKKNLEHMKEKERNWITNSAFMLLLICDVILNTLRDERPNLMDVLESRFHSY
jgi:hypothetical protein